jgi:hypothetical protein
VTHDIRDALIDALRPVCANAEVAADACLGVMEKWAADEPDELGEDCEPPTAEEIEEADVHYKKYSRVIFEPYAAVLRGIVNRRP